MGKGGDRGGGCGGGGCDRFAEKKRNKGQDETMRREGVQYIRRHQRGREREYGRSLIASSLQQSIFY